MPNGNGTSYKEYLASEAWRVLRKQARDRAENRCEFCGGPPDHVHHVRYPKRYQDDHLDNLVVACEPCHAKIHGIRGHEVFFGLCQSNLQDRYYVNKGGDVNDDCLDFEVEMLFVNYVEGECSEKDASTIEASMCGPRTSVRGFTETVGGAEWVSWITDSFPNGFIEITQSQERTMRLELPISSPIIRGWAFCQYPDAFGFNYHCFLRELLTGDSVGDEPKEQVNLFQSEYSPGLGKLGLCFLPQHFYLPFRYIEEQE